MALIQVGTAALRSPSGEFLPSVPIMREVPEKTKTAEITEQELAHLFCERMKAYFDASKEVKKEK